MIASVTPEPSPAKEYVYRGKIKYDIVMWSVNNSYKGTRFV